MNLKLSTLIALALVTGSGHAFAESHGKGDVTKGTKLFKKCAACHAIGPDAKIKVGPPMNGIVGRAAGTYEGMKFGKSLVAAGEAGLVWSEDELFEYLKNPKKYLRAKLGDKKASSKMAYKLKKEKDRIDIIAYLATFADDGSQKAE
jgi:cytochrome c2